MIRCHIFITGRVQGVFFRRFIYKNAIELRLKGWVRNKDHDKVEVLAEGEEEKINELVERCRHGPEGADVKDIKIEKEKYEGTLMGFGIAYS